ncbi:ABC transporter permease [Bacillus sp. DNRA2]|uniref:ABC transporter permease subunit n=1 Tax=Bacillus sp. DNRA2 TaxID=2723053 RepID=UPI00145ED9DE|nr:ABC transporter permease subunit [Bacillus sp. DNRA2]NMD71327.1 ABC transporter permease [Bacillus sp. DNRA2]
MNVFWREMKAHRKSLILWSIGIFLMVLSGMGKYEAYSSSGQSINDLMKDIPDSLKAVLGFGDVDLSTISGYYSLLFLYILLMATIHAAMLGASIIAKEERDKTSEFLFVKPIARKTVITAKLSAAFVNVVIFNLVTFLSLIVVLAKFNTNGEDVNQNIALTMIGMFISQLLFMMIGAALASFKRKPKTAASLATGILLLTYLLSIIISLKDELDFLKYLTPFKYFEAANVMFGAGIEAVYVIISVILIAGLTVVTYTFFQKRDLNI